MSEEGTFALDSTVTCNRPATPSNEMASENNTKLELVVSVFYVFVREINSRCWFLHTVLQNTLFTPIQRCTCLHFMFLFVRLIHSTDFSTLCYKTHHLLPYWGVLVCFLVNFKFIKSPTSFPPTEFSIKVVIIFALSVVKFSNIIWDMVPGK